MKRTLYILIAVISLVFMGCSDKPSEGPNSSGEVVTENAEQIDVTVSITIPEEVDKIESIQPIQMTAQKGDTIIDVTENADVIIDVNGTGENAYVEGINDLYALDEGPSSGWLVKVNGEFIEVGPGAYEVEADDEIEWLYTTDFNKEFE